MKPSELSSALRSIASRIDNTLAAGKSVPVSHVVADLKKVTASVSRVAKTLFRLLESRPDMASVREALEARGVTVSQETKLTDGRTCFLASLNNEAIWCYFSPDGKHEVFETNGSDDILGVIEETFEDTVISEHDSHFYK